jgi:hypothetical protein
MSTLLLLAVVALFVTVVKLPRLRERARSVRGRGMLAVHGTMSLDALATKTAASVSDELARTLPGQPRPNLVEVFLSRLDHSGLPTDDKDRLEKTLTDRVRGKLRENEMLVPRDLIVRVYAEDGVAPHRPSFRMSAETSARATRAQPRRVATPARGKVAHGHPTTVMPSSEPIIAAGHPTVPDPVRGSRIDLSLGSDLVGRPTERLVDLILFVDGRAVNDIELTEGVHVVGRARCTVRVPHETVSGRHCALIVTREEVTVHNLSETNGTFVSRLGQLDGHRPVRLADNDIIYLSGAVWLRVVRGADAH